jgi:hypothetical protein
LLGQCQYQQFCRILNFVAMLARYRLNACLTDEPRAAGGVDGLEECATNEAPSRE